MDGFLLIDKPTGLTSHDVVDQIRRITGIRQIGHAGTLDPMATGLLILGIGKATKQLSKLVGLDKEYEATVTLGATSDTFDAEGSVEKIPDSKLQIPNTLEIQNVLKKFQGTFNQKAPLFSAKKVKGQTLYRLARAGQATEDMRPVKRVTCYLLQVTSYSFPELNIRVKCSSGTYIRSLADDIGRALSVGGYLSRLRRTAIGSYRVEDAASLESLETDPDGVTKKIISL